MLKINLLDKTIFNRIAAGEVVERPASIVKELIENSVDANAKNIAIEVSGGGISKIKVVDDGIGMDAENLPKAFLPHATSKVATVSDLDKIGTLGFRGEALSSIASVSKVVAISKTKNADLANRLEIEGGEIINQTQVGGSDGTTIIVEDLFYNVPARAKFLKRPKLEESEITNIVSRLILANPTISIKYIVEDKIVFLSTGTDLKDAIYSVYGKVTVENLLPLKYEHEIFDITGYICKPTFSKPNRTYQTLIINGRYVINQVVSAAMQKAYEGFLMKGNFPFYVININIPLDKVDVNVHPNKLDVKFEEGNKIFGIILHAVSNALLSNLHIKDLESQNKIFEQNQQPQSIGELLNYSKEGNTQSGTNNNSLKEPDNINNAENQLNHNISVNKLNDLSTYVRVDDKLNSKRDELIKFITTPTANFNEINAQQDNGFSFLLAQNAINNGNNTNKTSIENVSLFTEEEIKIIGVVFGVFIIVQQGNTLYFIDQHAAHERILYDDFKQKLENKEIVVQQLLVPYVLDVNYLEKEFINNNLQSFMSLGFEIELFGSNSYKVSTVPVLFKDISVANFFKLVLKDINNNLTVKPFNLINDYLARSACRTAIKANDIMSVDEISKLLEDLNSNNTVLLCPHGRPVVVKITNTDIEKWFKRIV